MPRTKRVRDGARGCSVATCEAKHYATGLCRSHYNKNRRHGTPEPVKQPSLCECGAQAVARGMCKKHYSYWWYYNRQRRKVTGSAVSYQSAHYRVAAERGRARIYLCTDCQGPADDWTLKHDANTVTDDMGRMYSLNVMDYEPRCSDCHKAYDAKHGNRRYKTGAYATVESMEEA